MIMFIGIFLKRDNGIILIGGWFGKKFADNSRYLYQYLFFNKEKYNLKKVIWVTSSVKEYKSLKLMGYDIYHMHSFSSYYYHLKSGVHIICNSVMDDIIGSLSFNANKLQLWHGIGVKCINNSENDAKNSIYKNIKSYIFKTNFYKQYISCGGWAKCYWLSGSGLDTKWFLQCFDIDDTKIIETACPRNCQCLELLPNEKNTINILKKYRNIIMYFPTFRNDYSYYVHPLSDPGLVEFLEKNNLLWVEKLHSYADKKKQTNLIENNNILYLEDSFDINTILDFATILVTDYSTVVYEFILKYKKIVHYVPDYNYYKNDDRGFLVDFNNFFPTKKTYDTSELINELDSLIKATNIDAFVLKRYDEINQLKWNDHVLDYNMIVTDIFGKLGVQKG